MVATVTEIIRYEAHPDADRLMIATLKNGKIVVTGKHYENNLRGIYIGPFTRIPGYLAEDLWMLGKKNTNQSLVIEERVVRGVNSQGVFAGSHWQTEPGKPWHETPYWREWWTDGLDVEDFLGAMDSRLYIG